MSELSHKAQAVLDALCMEELNGPQQIMALAHAAAALRVAVEQCTYRDAWEDKFLSAERILAIADELEST